MTRKWNLIVDLDRCVDCHNCVLATKDEHIGNDFSGYSAAQTTPGIDTMRVEKHIRGSGTQVELTYVPRMCGHCDNAPCLKKDKRGVLRKREDGIMLLDPEAATYGPEIEELCPFGMIHWDEAAGVAHLWTFDAHLLDAGWQAPRCVQACPTSAMEAVKLDDSEMAKKAAQERLGAFPRTAAVKPRVYYRSLQRLTHRLVAGTVLREENGRVDCADGVTVVLHENGVERAKTVTDAFGEFAFGEVSPDTDQIELRLSAASGGEKTVALEGGQEQPVEIRL